MKEDFTPFFADFGIDARRENGAPSVRGIFDNNYIPQLGAEGLATAFHVEESCGIQHGEILRIGVNRWRVVNIEPSNGMSRLILEQAL